MKLERERVLKMALTDVNLRDNPLVIKEIRKVYDGGKIASENMCLAIERNMVLGLLGPNGAGKSTLIHMMVGLYKPTSGTAFVSGFDIISQMDDVYMNIGVWFESWPF